MSLSSEQIAGPIKRKAEWRVIENVQSYFF
jgi:hypothetical protein